MSTPNYYAVLTAAVADLTEHGFDSAERVAYWQEELRKAAERSLGSMLEMQDALKKAMQAVYERLVDKGDAARYHPGIARFTLERLRPQLRAELDRRILASAELIRLNREQAIAKTLQRFSGWATSIPAGGAPRTTDRRDTKVDIRKSLAKLPFEERRVVIDQNAKLVSSISDIVARDSKAIAAVWHSHWREKNYDYRVNHKARDLKVYLIRGSWAQEAGLVKPGADGYTDEITQPAEEPFCRCWFEYVYNISALPPAMLTRKGEVELVRVRELMNA